MCSSGSGEHSWLRESALAPPSRQRRFFPSLNPTHFRLLIPAGCTTVCWRRSREISSRLEAGLTSAARARSGSSHSGTGDGTASSDRGRGEEEEEDMAGYRGPAFEQRVFRDMWRCLMLCWNDKVRSCPPPLFVCHALLLTSCMGSSRFFLCT